MWILTQNGKRILSTEGRTEINVAGPAVGKTDFVIMLNRRTDGKPFALGFYRTLDHAMAILEDILMVQENFYYCQGGADLISGGFQPGYMAIPPKIYKMPPDNEMEIKQEIQKREIAL